MSAWLPTRRSHGRSVHLVHIKNKALRSNPQLAIARVIMKHDYEKHMVVSVEAVNSACHRDESTKNDDRDESWWASSQRPEDRWRSIPSSAVTDATYRWSHTNMLALPTALFCLDLFLFFDLGCIV